MYVFLIMSGNYWTHPLPDKHRFFPATSILCKHPVTIVLKTDILDLAPPGWPAATSPFLSHMCPVYVSLLTVLKVLGKALPP